MNCPKCGKELNPDMKFCANCGELVKQEKTNEEHAQPKPVAQSEPSQQEPKKQKNGKKNLALKIVAIVLAIIVFLTGGLFITDAILFKSESEKEGYITDFPVLKQNTEILVYDADKFPYENYNIKVDKFKTGKLFKSSTFSGFENIINERSSNPVFNLRFEEDGKYQITLEGIVSERTQAVTEQTQKQEEPKTVVIIVIVDDDNEKAVDKVTLNSKEDDEPIKDLNDVSGGSVQNPAGFVEASQADFTELEKTLNALFSMFYDPVYDCRTANLSYVLDGLWKYGGAYGYYFGESEYEGNYEKLPEENVKWICENIYNIKYDTNIEYNDYSYFYKDGNFYIGSYDVGGNEWDEYKVSSYNTVNGKYEIVIDTFRHSYETEDVVLVSKLKITAEIKILEGKKYWSFYKVENYDMSKEPSEEMTSNAPAEPEIPTQPPQPTQTPSAPSGTVPLDKNVKVGDYVNFGKYEQDNNTSNGKEDIEWLVLDVKDGKALVTSKYALDAQVYNEEYVEITWEFCTLRSWLNNHFYNVAFSSEEQSKIPTVNVVAEDSPKFGTDAGNDTLDKVFLLSEGELERYLGTDERGSCRATPYALAQGAYVYANRTDSNCWLWLRSPGVMQDFAAGVSGGGLYKSGYPVDDKNLAVRPVMWITLD